MQTFGQGVRFIPKLLWSLHFVLKGKTPLNQDILVVCDILECFLELLRSFHMIVISGSIVLKWDSIFCWICYHFQTLIWSGLSSYQTQTQGPSIWCCYLGCFACVQLHAFGLTNTFALFINNMSPSSWSILISLTSSPPMTFLFSPCWRGSYRIVRINVGNFWEPSLCHHEVCDLDVSRNLL